MNPVALLGVFKSNANVWAMTFASPAEFAEYHELVRCGLKGHLLFNGDGKLIQAAGEPITLPSQFPPTP
jgi:hypothetical protein